MGSSNMERTKLEMFEVGPVKDAYQMGFLIGQRFSKEIRSRLSTDLILQNQLLPFAQKSESQSLINALIDNNREKFPRYWDELLGTADGSGVSILDVILINFRKEILPFLPKTETFMKAETSDDCSDVLVVSDKLAIAAHNEDANVVLVGHTYLIKAILSNGQYFIGYTYAGELPSCAFGFNTQGLAFTLNSVPPTEGEIMAGGIGRNFVSRDLLEATSIDDALDRIYSSEVSVGHSYNLIDIRTRRILNVETASRNRVSVREVGVTPFFHANMYLHLQVEQVQDDNSTSRQERATVLPKGSADDFLSLLGDMDDKKYPIYMTGPTLYTLCTALIDLDDQTLSIIEGNPQKGEASYVFSMSTREWKISP
ncbi:uncharacterized protein LOC8287709 isoform X2 [Ricinus communis]|uniref:Peptidase C45 hydrolase domain-containing protein n=1 Tax=Ricinus communis TaxID=3988 RepID=B9RCL4_RICCO|nr:uncharacterized protein LOC8287709 isoform X2 [Ricinus communis]EEF51285.1 conserved hypothetical protein [Ricinus communis]|eukprot:XP_002509898.1 uncharacterized protein LOC8287709 isoform X2 [Ricinus communis]